MLSEAESGALVDGAARLVVGYLKGA